MRHKYCYFLLSILIVFILYTNDGRYLGKISGHKCIRINNHEYTDLQEYTGIYTTSAVGHSSMKVSVSIYSN